MSVGYYGLDGRCRVSQPALLLLNGEAVVRPGRSLQVFRLVIVFVFSNVIKTQNHTHGGKHLGIAESHQLEIG